MFSNTYFEGQVLGAMAGKLHVMADGDVKPNPYPPFSFENVKKEPLKEIWQKMRSYPYFKKQKRMTPMHYPEFLEFVDRIPIGAKLPYPFEKVYRK